MKDSEINNSDINVDRGLELILSHRRRPLEKDKQILSFSARLFSFDVSFSIKKRSRGKGPCKKYSSQ